jgi:glycosyltransferase involved in cell wall biosynthesis
MRIDDLEVRVLRNWLPFPRFRFDPFTPELLRELSSADIVHVHQPFTMMGTTAILHAKLSGRPLFASNLGGFGFGLHRLTNVDRFFDGHLHISEFSRRFSGHVTLPGAHTILGGTNVTQFRPPSEPTPRREVVFVGRILPHKGVNYLIEALDPDVPLAIVGRRWRDAEFDRLLTKLAEGKRIRFIEGRPPVDHGAWAPDAEAPEIVATLQNALCIVLPSVHTGARRDGLWGSGHRDGRLQLA